MLPRPNLHISFKLQGAIEIKKLLSKSHPLNLYHLIGYLSFPTLKKIVDYELTPQDFLEESPDLIIKVGSKKSLITKVQHVFNHLTEEELSQPNIKHLAATGLSENIIKVLQSFNIKYADLKSLNFTDFVGRTSGKGRESTYNRIMKSYTDLEELFFPKPKESAHDKENLLNLFLDSMGNEFFTINQLLNSHPSITIDDLNLFLKKDLLFNDGMWYRKKYNSLSYYIEINSHLKYIDVLCGRLDGKSALELSNEQQVSRQSISNREKVVLKFIPFTEEEALYKKFFEYFNCSKELFCEIFDESKIIYNFLSLRYDKGDKHLLHDIDQYPFTEHQKKIIIRHHNGFINHKNQLTILTKQAIFDDVLFYYGRNSINDSLIFDKFNEYILTHNFDIELAKESSELRGFKERSFYALQDRSHYYRYYDFNQLDEDEILNLKDLLDMPSGIYNMTKIYLENQDFMKSIDIRNENELHNLYRTFIPIKNVTYNRMPEFSIGNVTKKKFIIDLFYEQAPIHIDDFIDFVHDVYYLKKNSFKSFLQMELSEYISDDIIQVDYQDVTDEEKDYLKSILTSEIYTIEEIVELGSHEFDDFPSRFVNNMILNEFGYSIRGQFILNSKYKSADKYFTNLILKNDYFINERLPYQCTQNFWKTIYDLEKNLDIFKIEKNMYITLTKLEQAGISKADILDFQNQVKAFANKESYFSLALLKKSGFDHPLFNLGFEDIFYNRILWTDSEIKSITLAAGYLFIINHNDVALVDFLESIIQEYETVDCHDLIEHVYVKYNIQIDLQRTINLLQTTDVYYSPELSKFYSSKNIFFEEIYKK